MQLEYKAVESTVKPAILEKTEDTIYLRKDIESAEKTIFENQKIALWTYQEAQLTPEEFEEYSKALMIENAMKATSDSENIAQLVNKQETGDGNQMAIMEAIADLYTMVSSLGAGGDDKRG